MKEVIFVRIKATLVTYGDMKGLQYTFEDVRTVITEKLSEGFTYCGFVPVGFQVFPNKKFFNPICEIAGSPEIIK